MRRSTALLVAGSCAFAWVAVPTGQPVWADTGTPKVVVIVLENTPYSNILGTSSAPYLNSLIGRGLLFTDYHAAQKGSAPNYLAMTAGTTNPGSPPIDSIFRAFDQASRTWMEFEESMTGPCGLTDKATVPGSRDPLYTDRHDPAAMMKAHNNCPTNDVPLTSDAQLTALPEFTYLVPNECDDMHTFARPGGCPSYFGPVPGGDLIEMGDNWLAHVVPLLLSDPGVTVVITFDEGTDATAQHVFTVEVGAGVTPGTLDGLNYDHFGLLAGLYGFFGLGAAPGRSGTAMPLPIAPGGTTPRLSVAVEGPGSVASDPPGIVCGTGQSGTCSATFASGTMVTLTATPEIGSTFDGWSGDCSGTGGCVVSIGAVSDVTATFGPLVTLTVDPAVNGTLSSDVGGIDCPGTCSQDFAQGAAVSLTAQADPGFVFGTWGGDCVGVQTATCALTMDTARSATATFDPAPVVLTLDDADPAVIYNGWHGVVDAGANGGGYRVSNVVNDKATWKSTKATSVAWIAHKGPDGGKADVTIDGKSKGTVDLYAPAPGTLTKTFGGLTQKIHTVIVKILSGQNAASTDRNVSVDAFSSGANLASESDPSLTYDAWSGTASSHALGGAYRFSTASSATASVTFTGTEIDWVTSRGPAFGRAMVSIDGVPMGTVDLYQPAQVWQWAVVYGGLSSGTHTLVIHVLGQKDPSSSGTKVFVDGFTIPQ